MTTATVNETDAGARLDVYAGALLGISRAGAQKLIECGAVRVDGRPAPKNRRLEPGDVVEADPPAPEPIEAQPQDIPLDVVYEDGELLVVNKPQGMVVHPAPGNPDRRASSTRCWRTAGTACRPSTAKSALASSTASIRIPAACSSSPKPTAPTAGWPSRSPSTASSAAMTPSSSASRAMSAAG